MKPLLAVKQLVEFRLPGCVWFGVGAAEKLPEKIREISDGPVVLVTDSGLVQAGVIQPIVESLHGADVEVQVFHGVEPEPNTKNVADGLAMVKASGASVIVGTGGGSSLDTAKVIAALIRNEGKLEDYMGVNKLPRRGLPTILLPTTSGTGSEVSPIAIITDTEQNLKIGVVSPHLYCDVAIVDPCLTVSCPASVTAATGMDALTHAIEIYTNKFAVPVVDRIMLESIQLVWENLSECVHNGLNLEVRTGMAMASFYAGFGLGWVGTAAVHALAYPLGGMYHIAHGLANAILLPYVLEFNRPACEKKFAHIAGLLGLARGKSVTEQSEAFISGIVSLSREIGIPSRLREIQVPKSSLKVMAGSAIKVTRLLRNNPREMTEEDILHIYENAY
jgi:alcohol dehydrogenase class IV